MYRYTECGLDNVWLVNGYKARKTAYGPAVAVENVSELHKAIGTALVEKPGRLTGKELRFLRIEAGLSQKGFARIVKTDEDGVSRWERDINKVPGGVDVLMRALYREHQTGKAEILDLVKTLDGQNKAEQRIDRLKLRYIKSDWKMAA